MAGGDLAVLQSIVPPGVPPAVVPAVAPAVMIVAHPVSEKADADAALLRRIAAGEAAAAEVLVKRYQEALMRYLTRITGQVQAAEELHQQTWLSVLEHIEKFDASASGGFKAWLFRIATNKANDAWRSQGRDRAAKSTLRLVTETESPDASQRMQQSDEADRLRKAIALLPENQRQVLLLRYYSDLKFTEIADMLGCPLNTALGRMHKAMVKLKQLLA